MRVLAVQPETQPVDVSPPLDAAELEDGPLPRVTWPTWLQDGRLLLTVTTPEGRPSTYLAGADPRDRQLVYRAPAGAPIQIAPGVPYFASPSPNSRHIAFSVPDRDALALHFVELADTDRPPAELARGAPLFTTWSPKGDALLIHAGSVIHSLSASDPGSLTTIGVNSVDLRVPAWSPDGAMIATVRHGETRNAIVLIDRRGKHLARIGAVRGSAALAWSPAGDQLAVTGATGRGGYAGIELISVRDGETRTLTKEPVLMMLWSPDGARLAYLRRIGGEGQVGWRVITLADGPVRSSGGLYPGPLFGVLMSFFDQYLLTQRLWSPDGRYLLAAGRIATNGPPADLWGGSILLWDSITGAPLRSLCPGELASWQPGR